MNFLCSLNSKLKIKRRIDKLEDTHENIAIDIFSYLCKKCVTKKKSHTKGFLLCAIKEQQGERNIGVTKENWTLSGFNEITEEQIESLCTYTINKAPKNILVEEPEALVASYVGVLGRMGKGTAKSCMKELEALGWKWK